MLWAAVFSLFLFIESSAAQKDFCGLPANTSSLPDYAQAELHDIWRNYLPGQSCEKELLVQRDLFQVIDSFEPSLAEKIIGSKPNDDNNSEESKAVGTTKALTTLTTVTLPPIRTTRSTTHSERTERTTRDELIASPFITTRLVDITTQPPPEKLLLPESLAQNFQDYEEISTNEAIPLLRPDPLPLSSRRDSTTNPPNQEVFFPTERLSLHTKKDLFSSDYLEDATFDDVAMLRFDTIHAPFLRTASGAVKRKFAAVWNDNNIPSESLRSLKIQNLAMSLLNARQVREYNKWATKRRRVLKAREKELRHLSREAKRVLRKMSGSRDHIPGDPIRASPHAKRELTQFVTRFNRRRSKKLALVKRV